MQQFKSWFANEPTSVKYIGISYMYGTLRTCNKLSNASIKEYSHGRYEPPTKRPILYTERIVAAVLGGMMATIYTPFYLYEDTCNIEKRIRGIPPQQNGKEYYNIIDAIADL